MVELASFLSLPLLQRFLLFDLQFPFYALAVASQRWHEGGGARDGSKPGEKPAWVCRSLLPFLGVVEADRVGIDASARSSRASVFVFLSTG